jgi:hypothetical protein
MIGVEDFGGVQRNVKAFDILPRGRSPELVLYGGGGAGWNQHSDVDKKGSKREDVEASHVLRSFVSFAGRLGDVIITLR